MVDIVRKINLGKVLLGKSVIVSDPSYDPGYWYTVLVDDMKAGCYVATANITCCDDDKERVATLRINHIDYPDIPLNTPLDGGAGVNSGRCGFWDARKFARIKMSKETTSDFYDDVCKLTASVDFGGVNKIGAVSVSGFGNGGYLVDGAYVNGKCVALEVKFIYSEEEEAEMEWIDEEDEKDETDKKDNENDFETLFPMISDALVGKNKQR